MQRRTKETLLEALGIGLTVVATIACFALSLTNAIAEVVANTFTALFDLLGP